jgi:hypothetical protein
VEAQLISVAVDPCQDGANGGCSDTCKYVGPGTRICLCKADAVLAVGSDTTCQCIPGFSLNVVNGACEGIGVFHFFTDFQLFPHFFFSSCFPLSIPPSLHPPSLRPSVPPSLRPSVPPSLHPPTYFPLFPPFFLALLTLSLAVDPCQDGSNGGCSDICNYDGPGVRTCSCYAFAKFVSPSTTQCACLDGYQQVLGSCQRTFFFCDSETFIYKKKTFLSIETGFFLSITLEGKKIAVQRIIVFFGVHFFSHPCSCQPV